MRVLMATRGSSGHVGPLAPFGHALLRAGHEVLVVAQRQFRANVERTGLAFAAVDEPAADEWMPLMADFAQMDLDAANARMVGEFFAGLDLRAALPGQRAIVADWRPDVIVRETWEFASALVGELHGIPVARVGLGLAVMEELTVRYAAPGVDAARAELGLAADPAGERLRAEPYLTVVPEPLEDPAVAPPPSTSRFAHGPAAAQALPAGWWPGNDPLVYLTFGSVTAGAHLPYYPALYRAAIDALAALRARILVTIGEPRDLGELGALPANVRVERWVPNDAVAPAAAAIVCHGGYGTVLDALGHGVPLVVLPLFSVDQWANADAVARAGAGIALVGDGTRSVLALPGPEAIGRLAPAVRTVLDDPAFRRGAEAVAAARRTLPPVDAAVEVLASLRR